MLLYRLCYRGIFIFLFFLIAPVLSNAKCGKDITFELPITYIPFQLFGVHGYYVVNHQLHMYPVFIDSKQIHQKKTSVQQEIEMDKVKQIESIQAKLDAVHEKKCKDTKCTGHPRAILISPECSSKPKDYYAQIRELKNLMFNGFYKLSKTRFIEESKLKSEALTTQYVHSYAYGEERENRIKKIFSQDFLFTLMQIGEQFLRMFVENPDRFMENVNAIGQTPISIIKKEKQGQTKRHVSEDLKNRNGQPVTLDNCYCYVKISKQDNSKNREQQVVLSPYTPQKYNRSPAALRAIERNQAITEMPKALLGIDTMGPDVGVCTLSILLYDVLKNHAMPHRMIAMNSLIESLMALFYQKAILTKSIQVAFKGGYLKETRDYIPFEAYEKYDEDFCNCGVCISFSEYITGPESPNPTHDENVYFACCRMFAMSLQWAFTMLERSANPKRDLEGILSKYYVMAYQFFPQDLNAIAFIQKVRFKQKMEQNSDYFWHYLVSYYNQNSADGHLENTPAKNEATKKFIAHKLNRIELDVFGDDAVHMFNTYCVNVLLPEQIFSKLYYKTLLHRRTETSEGYEAYAFFINPTHVIDKKNKEIQSALYHLDNTLYTVLVERYRECLVKQITDAVKEHPKIFAEKGSFEIPIYYIPKEVEKLRENILNGIPTNECNNSVIVSFHGERKYVCNLNNNLETLYRKYINQERMLYSLVTEIIQPMLQKIKVLKYLLKETVSDSAPLFPEQIRQSQSNIRAEAEMNNVLHDLTDIWQLVKKEKEAGEIQMQTSVAKENMNSVYMRLNALIIEINNFLLNKSPNSESLEKTYHTIFQANLSINKEIKSIVVALNNQRESQIKIKEILKKIAADTTPPDYDCMCPVCLESDIFKNEDGSIKSHLFVMTPCQHKFCITCYKALQSTSKGAYHGSCVVCRGLYLSDSVSSLTCNENGFYQLKPVSESYMKLFRK